MIDTEKKYIQPIEELIVRYPQLKGIENEIRQAFFLLKDTYLRKGKILACGNGGSASDAAHIVGELMKSFVLNRSIGADAERIKAVALGEDGRYIASHLQGTLPAISLQGELALVSAYGNDVAPDLVFAQQVYGYGCEGDSLIAISTSGNSRNVIYAAQTARAMGLKVIGLTGNGGGKLKEISDVCICVPETETYKIQELHLPVYHSLCFALEQYFYGE